MTEQEAIDLLRFAFPKEITKPVTEEVISKAVKSLEKADTKETFRFMKMKRIYVLVVKEIIFTKVYIFINKSIVIIADRNLIGVMKMTDEQKMQNTEWLQNAIEQLTPKRVEQWKSGRSCCPRCKRGVLREENFCSICGQALDWSFER